jgi:predicted DNA-binding protein (MmcQ/YjbR family)
MDVEALRAHCLAKPGTEETFPFDSETLVMKVMGKMYALFPLEKAEQVALKCDPEKAMELREEWEEITAAWHMNKTHWNSVRLNGRLSAAMIRELVDHSYDLVVASLKKVDKERLAALKSNT